MTTLNPAVLDLEQAHESKDLARGLKDRHIQLIAIGGAIGVGLFLGSAKAIANAGPGLVLSYALGGVVIFFIMRALGELLMHRPVAGLFCRLRRRVRQRVLCWLVPDAVTAKPPTSIAVTMMWRRPELHPLSSGGD